MLIYPAIDLFEGKAVRLLRGDYARQTVYSDDPVEVSLDFARCGAEAVHLVDLEGAKSGETPNFDLIACIVKTCSLRVQVGGGIRTQETVQRYLDAGVSRVILGTAAVTNQTLLERLCAVYGSKIAVGMDLLDGFVAVQGWTSVSDVSCDAFLQRMQAMGVGAVICTDISRDGAMAGTNRALYERLARTYRMELIASGGVSDLDDVRALRMLGLAGAIIGKAYYTGAIDLAQAIEVAKC